MRIAVALAAGAIALVVAAGLAPPHRVHAVFPSGGAGMPELPVDVVDPGGLVESIDIGAPTSVAVAHDDIVAVPTIPTAVVVAWTGGECDIRTTATVGTRDDAIVVALRTDRRSGVCHDMGIHREITIDFSKPIGGRRLIREYDPGG